MVYEARLDTKNVKPRPQMVLDRRFEFMRKLDVGQKGQLDANLHVASVSLEMDETGNERITYSLILRDALLINNFERRR